MIEISGGVTKHPRKLRDIKREGERVDEWISI